MSPAEVAAHAAAGGAPGAVRMSLGAYSDCGDVDRAVDAVEQVARGAYRGPYARGADGGWTPRGNRVAAAG
jgi:hypothetical protein